MRAMRRVIEARAAVPSASENFCAPAKLREMALTIFPALSARHRHIPRVDFAGLANAENFVTTKNLSCLMNAS